MGNPAAGKSDGPTIILIPPAGGSPAIYGPLLRLLGPGRHVLGIQSHGLVSPDAPDKSLPVMARRYVADLMSAVPSRRCLMVGYSFGGMVAVEAAAILLPEVDRLEVLLVDADPSGEDLRDASPFTTLLTETLGIDLDPTELGLDPADRLPRIRELAAKHGKLPRRFPLERLERMAEVCAANQVAAADFAPTPFPGVLHTVWPVAPGASSEPPADPWRPYARDVVAEYITGDHFSILAEPAVKQVATVVTVLLDDLEKTS
jgi:thioesterase domain-containing protein